MSESYVGKLSPTRTNDLISGALGAECRSLIIGPGPGLDAAVLDLGDGRVMAVAEDPIFPAPGLPLAMMGEFTVHIGASDVAVTGIKPEFMTYTLLLPRSSTENEAREIINSISRTAVELGITVVGGHTGWYDAVTIPIVGGVTVWGFAGKDDWISPGGAQDGDVLLMTKGPSIEASALLGVLYADRLDGKMPSGDIETLIARTSEITVVQDALTAFAAGGVHAMHDATEGGVLGGVWEMTAAAGTHAAIDIDSVPVPEDIRGIADALGFDPWAAVSEGTLLAAVAPDSVDGVKAALAAVGIESFVLGRFDSSLECSTVRRGGLESSLDEPGVDPFWDLFFAGLQ